MKSLILDTDGMLLLALAGVLLLIQLLYYLLVYNRIHLRGKAVLREEVHFANELPPISVIITAREECENLRRNLKFILEQDYPQFEVIVINDVRGDESEDYLTQLENSYPNLYHTFVPDSSRYISRKKLAITLGIKASKYEWLVMTDADCRPTSNQWLRLLARNFTPRTELVLGYSGYERGKGWLHKRVAFDNLFTSMRYLGLALAGKPFMGIGRNMAYRKEMFYSHKGFSEHLNLQRGDDDLFVNQLSTSINTRVETDVQAVMRMQPVSHAKEWREEKIGYASTARLYRGAQRYLLGFETTSRILFHAAWILLLVIGIMQFHWLLVGGALFLFLSRWGVQIAVFNLAAKDLGEERRYYWTLPVFDFLQPLQSLRWKLYCLFRKKEEFLRR